jgi:hypothetical protein
LFAVSPRLLVAKDDVDSALLSLSAVGGAQGLPSVKSTRRLAGRWLPGATYLGLSLRLQQIVESLDVLDRFVASTPVLEGFSELRRRLLQFPVGTADS